MPLNIITSAGEFTSSDMGTDHVAFTLNVEDGVQSKTLHLSPLSAKAIEYSANTALAVAQACLQSLRLTSYIKSIRFNKPNAMGVIGYNLSSRGCIKGVIRAGV